MTAPLVSVVVPTYNRSDLLSRCLTALFRQSLPPDQFEILVIDNGSTDDTRAVIEGHRALVPNLRYFHDTRTGLLTGRHVGLFNATAPVILYLDDDAEPFPRHLQTLVEEFRDPAVQLVGGRCLPRHEVEPPAWMELCLEPQPGGGWAIFSHSLVDQGPERRPTEPGMVFGCNFAARRERIIACGGFCPDSMPWGQTMRFVGDGESGLSQRLTANGGLAVYNPDCSIHHWVTQGRTTPEYMYRRYFYDACVHSFRITRQYGRALNMPEIEAFLAQARHAQMDPRATGALAEPFQRKAEGYRDGFRFHQSEIDKDPGLLAWVLKPDYLDVH